MDDDDILDVCLQCGRPIRVDDDYRIGTYYSVHTFCQVVSEARAAERVNESLRRRFLEAVRRRLSS
jgi:hypothetical protein